MQNMMLKKLAATVLIVGTTLGVSTQANATSITLGTTIFNVDTNNNNAVTSIQDLEINGITYNINFISGAFVDLVFEDNYTGIQTFLNGGASGAQNAILSALNELYASGINFSQLEDVNGVLSSSWNVPQSYPGGGYVWWRGYWNSNSGSVVEYGFYGTNPLESFGGSTLFYTTIFYANFTESAVQLPPTYLYLPEPPSIIGSLMAVGLGLAIKKRFASVRG